MIGPEDHARIAAAIEAAEARTRGEIVCVLARGSSAYVHVAALWAAAVALAAPWLLVLGTHWSIGRILVGQLAVFAVALLLFSWAPVRMRLVPRPVQRARAHREAMEQFFARGMTRTASRCGVMIFVSLSERYARIIADEGIARLVRDDEWAGALSLLTQHMHERDIPAAFIAAIERCGDLLSARAPPDGHRDRLPDRLFVL